MVKFGELIDEFLSFFQNSPISRNIHLFIPLGIPKNTLEINQHGIKK